VIFVTVGTQLPFDRLVQAVDAWAGAGGTAAASFAQIGDGDYRPQHLEWMRYLPEEAFRAKVQEASIIVSHAGIGNLLAALQCRKPIVIMPRRFALGEHRNDHQVATANWLRQVPGVTVVDDAAELGEALSGGAWQIPTALRAEASPELLSAVRQFIEGR
jgi:exopolysaccharide biosynthesis glucuronosyltransferase PssE